MSVSKQSKFTYPSAHQVSVVDNYHGIDISDPYRWLENPQAVEVQTWVKAQNELTENFLSEMPNRQLVHERLTTLWNYARYTPPMKRGSRYFFQKNDGLQNQPILYVQESLESEAIPVIDPNTFSEDGTVALLTQAYGDDGRLLAYGLSESGSDWQKIYIRNLITGHEYDDVIQWTKFSQVAWLKDGSGFFYGRYPAPGEMPDAPPSTHHRVYFHKLGTPQAEDVLVYERPDAQDLGFRPLVTENGRYLVLDVWQGTDHRNRFYYRDLESKGTRFVRLLDKMDAKYVFISNHGPIFYFETDLNAPRGRIIAIDITNPSPNNWREVVPEQEDTIAFSRMVNNQLVVITLHNAHHVLTIYDLNGRVHSEIPFPVPGSIIAITGKRDQTEMFIQFQSFLYPSTIFRYDFTTAKLDIFRQPQIQFDPSGYETKQVFCTYKDGTQIPLFVTHKKGLSLDGQNPTLLYGYGGFTVNMTPLFSPTRLVWLEQGGVYAHASLRGGNEFGEAWHRAGMLSNKQNVFDDFIAAAEWLIANQYTSKAKLAIEGRSNGGLLVAACLTQRPDLFGAVHCGVPVIDMLRYHKFTAGRYWTSEYGNAEENAEHFNFMLAYSPLHNIHADTTYPPTLITTADTDDRVVPMHAKKFAATLQTADTGQNPILLRVEMKAGHGLGKPVHKLIEEATDIYAFLWSMLMAGNGEVA